MMMMMMILMPLLGLLSEFRKCVFALGTVEPIPGVELFTFAREDSLLRAWSVFMVSVDPDVVTGYNISEFDLPFLLERAHVLGVRDFP